MYAHYAVYVVCPGKCMSYRNTLQFCLAYGHQQLLLVWHLYHISQEVKQVCLGACLRYQTHALQKHVVMRGSYVCDLSWVETANSYKKTSGKTSRWCPGSKSQSPMNRVSVPHRRQMENCRYAWLIRPSITRETRASSLVADSGPCYHPLQTVVQFLSNCCKNPNRNQ